MRPALIPGTSHQTTRYEVDIKMVDGRWILDATFDKLPQAKIRASINRISGEDSRIVVVSEIRRLAP